MPLKHFSIQLLTRLPDDLNISTSLLEGKNGGVIGVGEVPFESIKGMMHKILKDTYIKVWYIGDLDVKIKLCKIKIKDQRSPSTIQIAQKIEIIGKDLGDQDQRSMIFPISVCHDELVGLLVAQGGPGECKRAGVITGAGEIPPKFAD